MSGYGDAFGALLSGGQVRAKRQRPVGAVTGIVHSVGAATATVILDGFAKDYFFGPMPFTRTNTPPQVGDQCLVVFAGSDENPAWLIGWQLQS